MKLRKLTSLALMGTLAAAMVVPAFAATTADEKIDFGAATEAEGEGTSGSASTEVSSTVNVPTLKVSVPTSGAALLNPYCMKYQVDGSDKTDQVINRAGSLENKTEGINIKVSCAPTVTLPQGVTLASAAADLAKAEDKQAFLELSVDKGTAAADPGASAQKITMAESADDLDTKQVEDATLELDDCKATTPNKFLNFKIGGSLSKVQGWTVDDTIGVNLAWTFEVKLPS